MRNASERSSAESLERWLWTSVTRIWGRDEASRHVLESLPKERWGAGDYVLAEVIEDPRGWGVENAAGRIVDLVEGGKLVGALGARFATLEATGSWKDVQEDGEMEILTGGGVLGRLRTISTLMPKLVSVRYLGHLVDRGEKQTMRGCLTPVSEPRVFDIPVVLLTGTSMSAGKTTAARVIIRRLKGMGLSVLGAKLAGAGRYRDILAMSDAGADWILDFVDGGLPSTYCDTEDYEVALGVMLARMAQVAADVAVVEIGASPLEPYGGEAAIAAIRDRIVMNVLCASDPYAVAGALTAYDLVPDLVTGTTSNTEAGAQLVNRLTGIRALDLRKSATFEELDRMLVACIHPKLPGNSPR